MSPASEYRRLRALGWTAREAWRAAKVNFAFAIASEAGQVEFREIPDDEPYDMGDPGDFTSASERERYFAAIRARLERWGHYGIASYARCARCGTLKQVDSVWGFVGDDTTDNGYDTDVKLAALEAIGIDPLLPGPRGR